MGGRELRFSEASQLHCMVDLGEPLSFKVGQCHREYEILLCHISMEIKRESWYWNPSFRMKWLRWSDSRVLLAVYPSTDLNGLCHFVCETHQEVVWWKAPGFLFGIQQVLNDRVFSGSVIGTTQVLPEWVWVFWEFEGEASCVMAKRGGHYEVLTNPSSPCRHVAGMRCLIFSFF